MRILDWFRKKSRNALIISALVGSMLPSMAKAQIHLSPEQRQQLTVIEKQLENKKELSMQDIIKPFKIIGVDLEEEADVMTRTVIRLDRTEKYIERITEQIIDSKTGYEDRNHLLVQLEHEIEDAKQELIKDKKAMIGFYKKLSTIRELNKRELKINIEEQFNALVDFLLKGDDRRTATSRRFVYDLMIKLKVNELKF